MNAPQNDQDQIVNKLADKITAMLAYWDKDLICRFANSAYLDWFGITKEEMIDNISIRELLGPLYEMNLPYIDGVLRGNLQTFEREIPLPDGKIRHSLANYYPDIIDGKVVGFFVHVADVNNLKSLELELQKSNTIICDQNKRLLNFSNIVSHNLKSYSNNFALVLSLLDDAKSDTQRDGMLAMLKTISNQFSSAVDHLNEVAKTQNQAGLKPEQISLYDFIEKAIEILKIQIISSKTTVINYISPEVKLFANPIYIESIFLNLLTNSIKYRSEERNASIKFSSYFEANRLAISIQDNGKGIDLEKHGKDLYGMYKTFHGNDDAQGIGLFITKYQIEVMGGEIFIDSKVNQGTTFTIYFNT